MIKGYKNLTEEQKKIFDNTYKKHQEQFEGKTKQQHEVVSIRPLSNKVLKVTCRNRDWYHYSESGTWY